MLNLKFPQPTTSHSKENLSQTNKTLNQKKSKVLKNISTESRIVESVKRSTASPNIFPNPEFLGRIYFAGFCNSMTTIPAIWRNLNLLNPQSNVPLTRLYALKVPIQTTLKGTQLGVFVTLKNFLIDHLPDDKKHLAPAIAYPLVSIPTQGGIYTNLAQGYFKIAGIPQEAFSLAKEIKKMVVAIKPTAARELGSTGLGMALAPKVKDYLKLFLPNLPENVSTYGAPAISGALCGLLTQGLHNLALTESSMVAKNEIPSTLGAIRMLWKEHGFKAFVKGSTGRIPNIAAGVWFNTIILSPLTKQSNQI